MEIPRLTLRIASALGASVSQSVNSAHFVLPGLEGGQCREHLGGGRVLILGDGA